MSGQAHVHVTVGADVADTAQRLRSAGQRLRDRHEQLKEAAWSYTGRHRSSSSRTMRAAVRRRTALEPGILAASIRAEAALVDPYRLHPGRREALLAAADLLDGGQP
jgi:hypothetical protein